MMPETKDPARSECIQSTPECDTTTDVEKDSPSRTIEATENNIVNWDGPEYSQNPMNWPMWKKSSIISVVSLMTFLSPLASTIVAPATELIMADFGSSNKSLAAFITSVHLLGNASGPLIIAPLSELYGRSPLYHCCSIIFLIFNIACAVSKNLSSLIVFRFLAALGASCPLTIGAGSIADLIPHENRGLAMAIWVIGPLIGPCVGPIIGGYLSPAIGWRWNFWLLSIVGGVAAISSLVFLRETYAYTLLERKTKALRRKTGNQDLRSALDTNKHPRALFASSIVRPLKMLLMSPIVFLLSLYMAVLYSYLYLCFTTFPRIFQDQYGFSLGGAGLAYLGIGIGSILGLFICGALSDPIVARLKARNNDVPKPEYRLPTLIAAAIIVPAGLFWYGWTAENKDQYMLPIIGSGLLGGGMVIAFVSCSTYLVDAYTEYAASATAAATVFRSLLGALLPLAGDSMYDALGVGWGTSLLGFIAVAFIPVPFAFIQYGERIRKSKLFKVQF